MQDLLSTITWPVGFGVLFSVLQVLFSVRNKAINYLFGIAGISLTLWVMFSAKLYAEFALNIYYLLMSIYGWWQWLSGANHKARPISYSSMIGWLKSVAIVIFSFLLSWLLLREFTDSDVPMFDALVAAFAWAGMWLMARRKMENWIFLNVSNLLAIPLMLHKDLELYALLSAFLFVAAIFGYFNWRKIYRNELRTGNRAEATRA